MMTVAPLVAEDAPDILALCSTWNQSVTMHPDAHGFVVRGEQSKVLAWGMLRETCGGFVVDDLWCTPDVPGRTALATVVSWLEKTVAGIAAQRGLAFLELGGIVRNDNPAHDAAMEKRGYAFIAKVRAKRITAEG